MGQPPRGRGGGGGGAKGQARDSVAWRSPAVFGVWSAELGALETSLAPDAREWASKEALLRQVQGLARTAWPTAQVHAFGSTLNRFGSSGSDVDLCLELAGPAGEDKAAAVELLAGLLRDAGMRGVKALPAARTPIVKFTYPTPAVSPGEPELLIECDVCINNLLAVINTRMLRDYAAVDSRLRTLVFAVKHWAQRRQINEPYRGTLSSYAYVLMCINLLQRRHPPILPVLQAMTHTTAVTSLQGWDVGYCDDAAMVGFGARNPENVGQLLAAFFSFWAFEFTYPTEVVSVRTGALLSKEEKGWTKRNGLERHLICIEDPFELTHDLGRIVDKESIWVIRDEFKRAASILKSSPNPLAELFTPFERTSGDK